MNIADETFQMAWDHDLKRVRHELVDKAGWGPDNDGDEGWAVMDWNSLDPELQKALKPLIIDRILDEADE